jgi:hypothetical protein
MELYTHSPHAFTAQTGTTLHDKILEVSVTHYVADYWVDVKWKCIVRNEWSYTPTSPVPSWHRQERLYMIGY